MNSLKKRQRFISLLDAVPLIIFYATAALVIAGNLLLLIAQ